MSLIFTSYAFAESCLELEQKLAAIEYKMNTTKLDDCSADNKEFCQSSDKKTKITLMQAKREYEQALAEFTILDGLTAMQLTLEGKVSALQNLSAQDKEKALKDSQDFLDTFEKTSILYQSLDEKDGKNFWTDFKGDSLEQLNQHLDNWCKEDHSICEELKELDAAPASLKEEIKEMLLGFHQADRKIPYGQDGSQLDAHNSYKNYLLINGKKPLKAQDLGVYQKVLHMHDLLSKDKLNPTQEQDFIKLSQQIEDISVGLNSSNKPNNSLAEFTDSEIKNGLKGLIRFKDTIFKKDLLFMNLEKAAKRLDQKINYQKSLLKSQYHTKGMDKCDGDILQCLNDKCADPNAQERSKGITALCAKREPIEEMSKVSRHMKSALNQCKEKETPNLNYQCAKENLQLKEKEIDSELLKAKDKLRHAQENLEYLTKGRPLVKYEHNKALLLDAYDQKGCKKDERISEQVDHYCKKDISDPLERTFTKLQSDTQDIIIEYNKQQLDQIHKNDAIDTDKVREDYIRSQRSTVVDTTSITSRKREPIFNDQAWSMLGQTAVYGIGSFMQAKQQMTFMDNSLAQYDNFMTTRYNYQNMLGQYQQPPYYMNWGMPYYNYNMNAATQFQQGNQQLWYTGQNLSSVNFPTVNTISDPAATYQFDY